MANRLKPEHRAQRTAVPVGLGVAAVIGAGIAWEALRMKRPAYSAPRSLDDRDASLVAYLREHLSGADVAIVTVERLSRSDASADLRDFFDKLHREFMADREAARSLLRSLGASPRSVKRLVSRASGRVLSLTAGGVPGELSLFRTLEALSVGVQGKRCLWTTLQAIDPHLVVADGRTLSELESAAMRQWQAIEERRRDLARATFPAAIRRETPADEDRRNAPSPDLIRPHGASLANPRSVH